MIGVFGRNAAFVASLISIGSQAKLKIVQFCDICRINAGLLTDLRRSRHCTTYESTFRGIRRDMTSGVRDNRTACVVHPKDGGPWKNFIDVMPLFRFFTSD
jgi:hypothetical protein